MTARRDTAKDSMMDCSVEGPFGLDGRRVGGIDSN